MKTLAIVFLLLSFCSVAQAKYGQARLDSLLLELPQFQEDTNRVNLLYEISLEYFRVDPERGIDYGEQALRLSVALSWRLGQAKAYYILAYNKLIEGNYLAAMQHAFSSLRTAEELGNKRFIGKACAVIAMLLPITAYEKAQAYHLRALKIAEELGDQKDLMRILTNFGIRHKNREMYPEALAYLRRAYGIALALNDSTGLIFTTTSLGETYHEYGKYAQALPYEFKALRLSQSAGDRQGVALNLGYIGKTYLAIARDTGFTKPDSLIPGDKSASLSRAAFYLKDALSKSQDINLNEPVSDISGKLWVAYELQGNYRAALETYRMHNRFSDSLYDPKKKEELNRVIAEREMEAMKNEMLIKELENRNERFYFIGGIMFLIVSSGFVIRNIQRKRLQEKQAAQFKTMIETQERERRRISRDLHDDIGTKLSALRLFLSSMKEKTANSNPELSALVENSELFVREAVHDLRQLLSDLSPSVLEEFGYSTAVEGLVSKINQAKLVHFNLIIFGMKGRISRDYELALYRITQELINNVLKHAAAKNVTLQIGIRDELIVLMIEDDGKGFELSEQAEGYGLKNLAARTALMNGKMTIDTAPGRGTSVTIEIPLKPATSDERLSQTHATAHR